MGTDCNLYAKRKNSLNEYDEISLDRYYCFDDISFTEGTLCKNFKEALKEIDEALVIAEDEVIKDNCRRNTSTVFWLNYIRARIEKNYHLWEWITISSEHGHYYFEIGENVCNEYKVNKS